MARSKTSKRPAISAERVPGETDDERASLRQALAGVAPLTGSRTRNKAAQAVPRDCARVSTAPAVPMRFVVTEEDGFIEAFRADAGNGPLRDLRRGNAPVSAEIDLHGMRRNEARLALLQFVKTASERGWRIVRVVHGQGRHSPGAPVLGPLVTDTITNGEAGSAVLALSTAGRASGGKGATLLRLARKKR